MKHLVYDKTSHKIISVLNCSEQTAMLQESEDHGVLVNLNVPLDLKDFSAYEVVDGLLELVSE